MKIATLTLNPCIDKTMYFSGDFRTGMLNRAAYSMLHAGGKGINVARIYRLLGIRAMAYGFSGGETGELLKTMLHKEDISVCFTETAADTRLCVKLIDAGGVCTEANEAGGPITELEFEEIRGQLGLFAERCEMTGETGYLFAGGSVPAGLAASVYRELVPLFAKTHVKFILDADGEALREGLRGSPWLIKPNAAELSELVGYEITGRTPQEQAMNAAKASRRIGAEYGTNVLCTLGSAGAVYTCTDGSFYVNAPEVSLRGFTGAGDAFLASFVFAYEKNGQDPESALCFASSAAAAKVELSGTEMPDKEHMMKFVKRVHAGRLDL